MRHAFVLLTLVSLNACELFTGPEGLTIQVQGTVTAADGTPAAGATVRVFGFGAYPGGGHTTDASGDYSLSFVVPSCWESPKGIIVSYQGFGDRIVGMTCTEELQTIDIQF